MLIIFIAIDTDIAQDAKLYSCYGCIAKVKEIYADIQSFILYSETKKVKCKKYECNEFNEFIFFKVTHFFLLIHCLHEMENGFVHITFFFLKYQIYFVC